MPRRSSGILVEKDQRCSLDSSAVAVFVFTSCSVVFRSCFFLIFFESCPSSFLGSRSPPRVAEHRCSWGPVRLARRHPRSLTSGPACESTLAERSLAKYERCLYIFLLLRTALRSVSGASWLACFGTGHRNICSSGFFSGFPSWFLPPEMLRRIICSGIAARSSNVLFAGLPSALDTFTV